MRINVRNLGALQQAEFEIGNWTMICGDNNTGKTYATYALYGFLLRWRSLLSVAIPEPTIDALLKNGLTRIDVGSYAERATEIIRAGCEEYQRELASVFASTREHFEIAEFLVHVDDRAVMSATERVFERRRSGFDNNTIFSFTKATGDSDLVISLLTSERNAWPAQTIRDVISNTVIDLLFEGLFPRPFIASAERTGATMFRNDLDVSPFDIDVFFNQVPDYPLPITANVDFARRIGKLVKRSSFLADDHPDVLREFSDVIGGDYVVEEDDTVRFQPTHRQLSLTMDESSSAVRALLDIGLYLRHVARPGDLLMVDEPELNLHPRNQRRIARLFARLANLGIRVFATTHSDYIVKELNTLIMLNQDKPHLRRLAERKGYRREELMRPDQIRVFIAELVKTQDDCSAQGYTLVPASVDPELGIEARSFDKTIDEMNEIQDAIVWGDDE